MAKKEKEEKEVLEKEEEVIKEKEKEIKEEEKEIEKESKWSKFKTKTGLKRGTTDVKILIIIGIVFHLINIFWFNFEINGITLLLNLLLAVVAWITVFDEDITTIIIGIICMYISLSLMSNFTQFGIGFSIGQGIIGMLISFSLVIGIIFLVSKHILQREIDWNGILIVVPIFLLQLGLLTWIFNLINLDNYIANKAFLSPIIWPWWVILGAIFGAKTESKLAKVVFYLLIGWVFFMVIFYNPTAIYASFGSLSDIQKEDVNEDLKKTVSERWENVKITGSRIACFWDGLTSPEEYNKCMEKTAPKKKLTEEEILSFSVNRKKPKRMDLFLTQPEIDIKGNIYTQLRGQSFVDKAEILLGCGVNGISEKVNPESALTEKDNLNWWKDIECKSELKPGNYEVEFRAQSRQDAEMSYPNYIIAYTELKNTLNKHKTADYVEMENKCKDKECIKNVQKSLYQNIEDFREKIIDDYPDFETSSIVDDEPVYLLLYTDYIPIIGVKEEESNIDLVINIANMGEGNIVAVHDIEIEIPDFIEITKNCDILEGSNGKYKFKEEQLKSIVWSKIKYGKEEQKRIGKCQLKIPPIKNIENIKFTDMAKLNKVVIRGAINFEYQLKSKGNIYYS